MTREDAEREKGPRYLRRSMSIGTGERSGQLDSVFEQAETWKIAVFSSLNGSQFDPSNTKNTLTGVFGRNGSWR